MSKIRNFLDFLNGPRVNKLLITFTYFIGAFTAFYILSSYMPYSLAYNGTSSIPIGLYVQKTLDVKKEALHYNQYVCFYPKEPEWAKGRGYFVQNLKFCKQVAGLAGDTVEISKGGSCPPTQLQVIQNGNSKPYCMGPQQTHDSKGRPVPRGLQLGVVPEGKVVVSGRMHPMSIDSRYLGALSVNDLVYEVYPIWTK